MRCLVSGLLFSLVKIFPTHIARLYGACEVGRSGSPGLGCDEISKYLCFSQVELRGIDHCCTLQGASADFFLMHLITPIPMRHSPGFGVFPLETVYPTNALVLAVPSVRAMLGWSS